MEIKIRELIESDEAVVKDMCINGIRNNLAHRTAMCFIKSKGFLTFLVLILAILYSICGASIALGISFLIFPCIAYYLCKLYIHWEAYADNNTATDTDISMYQYWTRPEVPTMKLWVALVGSEIAGCVAVRPSNVTSLLKTDPIEYEPDKTRAALERMYVFDKWRGKRIGLRLLQHAIQFCESHGFREIEIVTSTLQNEAKTLYEKHGFETQRSRKLFFGYNFRLDMVKTL